MLDFPVYSLLIGGDPAEAAGGCGMADTDWLDSTVSIKQIYIYIYIYMPQFRYTRPCAKRGNNINPERGDHLNPYGTELIQK